MLRLGNLTGVNIASSILIFFLCVSNNWVAQNSLQFAEFALNVLTKSAISLFSLLQRVLLLLQGLSMLWRTWLQLLIQTSYFRFEIMRHLRS